MGRGQAQHYRGAMAYCTQADIENCVEATLLVELTDDARTGSVNSTVIARAIADADCVINGYLQLTVSLDAIAASVPALVRKLSVDIAIYNLFMRRGANFDVAMDWIGEKYKSAIQLLRDIRAGKIDLGVEPLPAASPSQVAATSGPERLFTTDTLEDF